MPRAAPRTVEVTGDRTRRGLGRDRRLLRRPRPPPRVLHRALRPPVRGARHLARRTLTPGRPRRAQRAPGRTAPGSRSTRRRAGRSPAGRHLLHEPRRRAREPRGGGRRADFDGVAGAAPRARWAVDARHGDDRRRHARPAASPSTPRSTTRFCTPTWSATSTAPTPASTAGCTSPTDYTPMGELLAVGHLPAAEPAARAARAGGRARRRAVAARRRARGRLAAALVARRLRDEHHDRRPGDAVPGRELVRRAARRPRAGGLPRAARQRARHAAGELAVQRPHRQPLVHAARLHPGGNGLRRARAATTTASTRRRRRSSTPPRTRRSR